MSGSPDLAALLGECSKDEILRGRLRLWQPLVGYRFSVDALVLSHFASRGRADSRGRAIDLGAGCGVVGLALALACPGLSVTLVELGPRLAALCRQNAIENGLSHRVEVLEADLRRAQDLPIDGGVELLVSNPPFRPASSGRQSPDPERARALVELTVTLPELVASASRLLAPGGALAVIYPPERLGELLEACVRSGLGPCRLRALHPLPGAPARRLLLEAQKGGRSPLVMEPPLFLHEAQGSYSPEAAELLGDAPSGFF
ncbi:MAG: methyltransferase [Polyangia bacterium]|jgi:tRNA1Val (adenine37-N6)-methyltransferase|nr:methyltransferase [Polyangia bacterium]